jgi:hypothetical protein
MGRLGMAMPCDSCSRSAAYNDRTASARSDFTGSITCPFVRERSPSEKGISGADPSSGPQAYMLPDARCLRLRRSIRDVLARARVPLLEGAKPQCRFKLRPRGS